MHLILREGGTNGCCFLLSMPMMGQPNAMRDYHLSRRIGLVVTGTILVFSFLFFFESARRVYLSQLVDQINELEDLGHQFSQALSFHLPQIMELERREDWDREDRILAIHSLLQSTVESIVSEEELTGLGYYSKSLQAIVAITPWEESRDLLGASLVEDHPSVRLYTENSMQREVSRVFRGKVARYAKLIYWNGEPVGHLWANLPITVLYWSFLPSFLFSIFLGLIGVGFGLYLTRYISSSIKEATGALEEIMDNLWLGSVDEVPFNEERDQEIPLEFQPVYQRFSHSVLQIREMTLQLAISAKMAALGDLVTVVAHDIRNPLATIMARAQLGKQIAEGEKDQSMYDGILNASKLMDGFLERILQLAKTRQEKREWFSIHIALSEMLELWNPLLKEKEIQLSYMSNKDLPLVLGDSVGFQQAFLNLLKNAIEATPTGGKIQLSTDFEKEHILIHISDSGPGIPENIQKQIFHRFFTTKKQNGSGIGLALAHSIITEQGGKIWFTTTRGQGTTFYIQLPVSEVADYLQVEKTYPEVPGSSL